MPPMFRSLPLIAAALLAACTCPREDRKEDPTAAPAATYVFSWALEEGAPTPRGGTMRGAPVTPAPVPRPEWVALQEEGLDARERDRRAIRALAGTYQVSFEFLETVPLRPGYERAAPYRSWATEIVYVAEDTPQRIVLQHVMLMYFVDEDGSVSNPMLIKHWRQDWTWQDRTRWRYRGGAVWEKAVLPAAAVAGTWSQAVWGVTDAPRYEVAGRWHHDGNHSVWRSDEARRPIPLRDSGREDYDVVASAYSIVVTPEGWLHEHRNRKIELAVSGEPAAPHPNLVRELGLNRYRAIAGFGSGPADVFWAKTAPFWAEVRAAWDAELAKRDRIGLRHQHEGLSLFEHLMDQAELVEINGFERERDRAFARAKIPLYIGDGDRDTRGEAGSEEH